MATPRASAGQFPSPALSERPHRSLACWLVAADRRAVLVVAIAQHPQPRGAHGRGGGFHDAADNYAFGKHVIIAPPRGHCSVRQNASPARNTSIAEKASPARRQRGVCRALRKQGCSPQNRK